MRIVLVIDQFDTLNNGTTATARRYAQELRERGHTVIVLASGKSEKDKITVSKMRIPFFQPLIEKQGFCFAKGNDEAYFQAFQNADIIHFFLPTFFCRRGEELARQMNIPTIAAFHLQPENITYSLGVGKSRKINDAVYRYFYYSFYSRFRYIHCPSQMIADQLESHQYDAQCRVISNGVSSVFKPKEASPDFQFQDKFVILMVGRFSAEKRQDVVIKAVQQSRYKNRIQLVFAGKGPKENKYRRLGKKLPNMPVFRFYSQEELIEMINASDLYVHASDAEIEGISCLEAMACGLVPVISDSELSATKEFALQSNSLFHSGDAASLAEKINYWIEHPQEKFEIGRLYAQKADEMRVESCVAGMEELYKEVTSDYRLNDYKKPAESRIRRMTHPDVDGFNFEYVKSSFFKRGAFLAFTNFLAIILYIIDAIFFGLEIKGRKNLKIINGGAVTVMNHVHPMDCTMVKVAVFPRPIHFTSLRRNLELPFVGGFIRVCGALPLPASLREKVHFQKGLKNGLQRGDWVHYYPEGMLVRYHQELRDFHPGAFLTAVHSGCPVIPMVITYLHPRGLWRIPGGKRRMILSIGEPQYPDNEVSPKKAVVELMHRTKDVMQQMINEPAVTVNLSPSLAVRFIILAVLTVQVIRYIGKV